MSESARPAPILTFVGDEPVVTLREVAQAIGWLDRMSDGGLEFDGADWSNVDTSGLVHIDGRRDDLLVSVTVQIVEVHVAPDDDICPDCGKRNCWGSCLDDEDGADA